MLSATEQPPTDQLTHVVDVDAAEGGALVAAARSLLSAAAVAAGVAHVVALGGGLQAGAGHLDVVQEATSENGDGYVLMEWLE